MHYEVYGYSVVIVEMIEDEVDKTETFKCYTNEKTVKCDKPYTYPNKQAIKQVQLRFKRVFKKGLLIHHKKITKK